MRLRGARRKPRGTCRAGNTALESSAVSTLGKQSCTSLHALGTSFACDCGEHHNPFYLSLHSGSRHSSPRGRVSYGPQRRKPPLKIYGGGVAAPSSSTQDTPGEALASSTSERTGSPASSGTSLGWCLQGLMEEHFGGPALTDAQRFLFDLCQKDLHLSVQRYRTSADPHHGQLSGADLHPAKS